MQETEYTKRKYYTKAEKMEILNELRLGEITISQLARNHSIHPVTIHNWRRQMGINQKVTSSEVRQILKDSIKHKQENELLKQSLADMAMDKKILEIANDILKKKLKSKRSN